MNYCPLILVAGRWTCPQCGWVYRLESATPPRRHCPKAGPLPPMPDPRTDEEIAACRAVCAACDEFRYGDARGDWCNACKSCGSERAAVYEAKLRVGDCPRGKWPTQSIEASQ